MVNGCNRLNLLAYRWPRSSLSRLKVGAGVTLICLSRLVLGLNSSRRVKRRWLCFYVIEDLLDDVWISDVGDDTQGTAAYRT